MCMSGGGGSVPPIQKPQSHPAPVDEQVVKDMTERRRKARAASGHGGTILTSGLDEPTPRRATLLGG